MLKLTPWFLKYRLYSLLEHHLEFNSSIWISKITFDIDASCDSRDGLKSHGLSGSSREEVVNEKIRKLLSRLLVDTLCILIRTIVISLIIVTKWTSVLPKWTSAVNIRRPPIITMILGTINDASGTRIGELTDVFRWFLGQSLFNSELSPKNIGLSIANCPFLSFWWPRLDYRRWIFRGLVPSLSWMQEF